MNVVQVQFGTKATDVDFRKWHRVSKIVIHPDYWQGPNEVAQPHDVALAMVEDQVFSSFLLIYRQLHIQIIVTHPRHLQGIHAKNV